MNEESADKVTIPAGSKHFYGRAGTSDMTLTLYEDHFRDLLNDVGKEPVMADVVAWANVRRVTT